MKQKVKNQIVYEVPGQEFFLYLIWMFSECVGAFGTNCSNHCGPGSYGGQCKFKCQCPEYQCDRVNGCMKDKKGHKVILK